MRYNTATIKEVLIAYKQGLSPKVICDKFSISKATLFAWIAKNNITSMRENKMLKTTKDFIALEKQYNKINIEKNILEDAFDELNLTLEDKIKVAEKLLPKYPLKVIARMLHFPGYKFYYHVHRRVKTTLIQKTDEFLKPIIRKYFYDSKERLSCDKIFMIIKSQNIKCSKRRIGILMSEMDLHLKRRSKAKKEKNDRPTTFPVFNKLKQEFNQPAPNLFWSGDVTMVKIKNNRFYIAIVMDLFSRFVIGYYISTKNDSTLVINALKNAYEQRNCPIGVTFHSDQGASYKSIQFRNLLYTLKISQSFSKRGTPYDNSVIEAFFSNLKQGDLNNKSFEYLDELKLSVQDYIQYYNNMRPHKALGYKTPQQTENEYYKKGK